MSRIADGVTECRRAARNELRKGATQIKILASGGVASPYDPIWNLQYSEEEVRAIVEEAQAWHTYVLAHAYSPEAIRDIAAPPSQQAHVTTDCVRGLVSPCPPV